MRQIAIAAALLLIAAGAAAQPAPPFAPIADRDLWDALVQALDDIPMSVKAHQQVQQLLQNVEREAAMREARAKAAAQQQKPDEKK